MGLKDEPNCLLAWVERLKDELESNIFLRANDVKNFSKLRDLKDNF